MTGTFAIDCDTIQFADIGNTMAADPIFQAGYLLQIVGIELTLNVAAGASCNIPAFFQLGGEFEVISGYLY